jgi:hypothetical protein
MTAIDDKHAQVRDLLGSPTTSELPTPDGIGRFPHYQRGSIYFTPSTGAHEIHGGDQEQMGRAGFRAKRSRFIRPPMKTRALTTLDGQPFSTRIDLLDSVDRRPRDSRGDHHQMGLAGFRAELPRLPTTES